MAQIVAIKDRLSGAVINQIIADEAFAAAWIEAQPNAADLVAEVVPPPDDRPYRERVDAYRDQVVAAGVDFDLPGYGTIHLQGRPQDMVAILGLSLTAQQLQGAGQAGRVLPFRDRENIVHQLTPGQIVQVFQVGSAFVSSVMQASWAMKDAGDESVDPADRANWP